MDNYPADREVWYRYHSIDSSKVDLINDLQAVLDECPRANHAELQRKLTQADALLGFVLEELREEDAANARAVKALRDWFLDIVGARTSTGQTYDGRLAQTSFRPEHAYENAHPGPVETGNDEHGIQNSSRHPAKRPRLSLEQTQSPSDELRANWTSPAPRATNGLAPIRRPGRRYTKKQWTRIPPDRQRQLSHKGYIEETDAGMVAPEPCSACSESSLPGANSVCMAYKPETVHEYYRAVGQNWRSCSECMGRRGTCSFVADANARLQATAKPRSTEDLASASNPPSVQEKPATFSDPRRKPPEDMAPLRRPLNVPPVKSYDWDSVNDARKRRLSHFGYIQETDAGMLAPKLCTHCSYYRSSGNTPLVCRVYDPTTVSKYSKATAIGSKKCGWCWISNSDCSFVVEAQREAERAAKG
ncbi:unnamed protein product [Zymoseptoria tritici ST99CH_3D1]|nr:unnamed protein product [Zymoseptoria tritici ST99CH_3D1]